MWHTMRLMKRFVRSMKFQIFFSSANFGQFMRKTSCAKRHFSHTIVKRNFFAIYEHKKVLDSLSSLGRPSSSSLLCLKFLQHHYPLVEKFLLYVYCGFGFPGRCIIQRILIQGFDCILFGSISTLDNGIAIRLTL